MTFEAVRQLAEQGKGLPRYTSYPPANHFLPGQGRLLGPAMIAAARAADAVSVYVHIPYCDRLCWFCACHTKQTLRYGPVADYVDVLIKELALWHKALGMKPKISTLHFGGGSPSLLRHQEWMKLRAAFDDTFSFTPQTEIAVEIDPSDKHMELVASLKAFGLTRASIGVQDFDADVQVAINRPQAFEDTKRLIDDLRAAGISSINIDAIYGLPLQTGEKFKATLAKVVELRPDRIALFGYAHVPHVKTHQRMIDESALPSSEQRFQHAIDGHKLLEAAGYQAIGIDHFALPEDALALAAREGKLVRNFQGYTTDDAPVRIGLGASSIGAYPQGHVQNEVAVGGYTAAVQGGKLPFARGLELTQDDQMRAYVISELMCHFGFSFAALKQNFGESAEPLIAEAQDIAAQDAYHLCRADENGFYIARDAQVLTRIVAARFDQWLKRAELRYSQAV